MLPPYANLDLVRTLPTPWQLFDYLCRSHHLHFGLFELGDDIAVAQERMTEVHLQWLPARARRVLDVGCGLGGTACTIALQGREVVGIAPDRALVARSRMLADRCGVPGRARFEAAAFEDLREQPAESFDAVLFLESFQHVPDAAAACAAVAAMLPRGGRCVIGDQVRRGGDLEGVVRWFTPEQIVRAAAGAGLRLVHRADLTSRARASIAVGYEGFANRRDEILGYFAMAGQDLAAALQTCIDHGRAEDGWWQAGAAGWELLVFER